MELAVFSLQSNEGYGAQMTVKSNMRATPAKLTVILVKTTVSWSYPLSLTIKVMPEMTWYYTYDTW